MKKILQAKEKALRQKAKEIPLEKISTLPIKKVVREMSEALRSQSDGVALAAPQIGYPFRIFVVSEKILNKGQSGEKERGNIEAETRVKSRQSGKDLVFINPKIVKLSREKEWVPEGCLSVRPLYGQTNRAKKATVSAYNEKGKKFSRGGSGLLAQIFQHEIEHLEGILFIDHAKDIYEDKPEKSSQGG
jgi:peptide deformylase